MFNSIENRILRIKRGNKEYSKIKEVEFKFGEPNYFVGYSDFTSLYFTDCERLPTMGLKYISQEDAHTFMSTQNKLIEEEKYL